MSEIEQESSVKGLDNEHLMFNAEIQLYDLIINILETKSVTDEEKDILKNFLQDNLYKIETNEDLKQRLNIVLN